MNQQRGQDQTDRPSGDAVEGSLTNGGSLPGSSGEDRSFGAENDETGYGQETGPLASGDTGGASGSSGSTGASAAGAGGGGDAHLGSAGTGGTAAGDQQTATGDNAGQAPTGQSQAGYGNGGGR